MLRLGAIFVAGGWTSKECFTVQQWTTLLRLIIDPRTWSLFVASYEILWDINALVFAKRIASCWTTLDGGVIFATLFRIFRNPFTVLSVFAVNSVVFIIDTSNATRVTGCRASKHCRGIKWASFVWLFRNPVTGTFLVIISDEVWVIGTERRKISGSNRG